jgi:hypothetical protein
MPQGVDPTAVNKYIYIYTYIYICFVFIGLDNKVYKMQGTHNKMKNRNCQSLNSLRPKYIKLKSKESFSS